MTAIYKREVRSYLTSMLGYVFMALNLLLTGIYFTYYNLGYGYPYLDYTLSGVSFVFMITTPILTMKVMAEERKQKTDQLLLTSPVSPLKIILGKYLALVTMFLIPVVIIACYPLILSGFGTIPFAADYTALFGYFLLGCAYLALGLFMSSLTESPVLAAVLSFGTCFLLYMEENISSMISGTALATYIACLLLAVLISLIIYAMTKKKIISGGLFAAAAIALTVCYFVKSSFLSGGIQKILSVFDFGSRFSIFLNGILDLRAVLYYLSAIVVCCFLAVQSIEKRRWGYHHGSYSVGWAAAVLAIIVVFNLTAEELPSSLVSKDMTANQFYTLSSQSRDVLKGLESDITIYELVEDGVGDSMTENLLEQYAGQSSHIKVVQKDLVTYPTFASNYTDSTLKAGSLIVTDGERSKVIADSDLYEYSYDSYTYAQSKSAFDGEGQITSAISYVTAENMPKIYALQGHKEGTLSAKMEDQISKENLELDTLNLISAEAVPDDAAILLINSPQTDLSDEETEKILNYLKNGGKAFITSTYTETVLPNFNSVLEYYGASPMDSVVVEGNSSYYHPQSPLYLLPKIESTEMTSTLVSEKRYVFTAITQGIASVDTGRDTVSTTALLTTSDQAYAKADAANMTTLEKEKADTDGPFDLAVYLTDSETDTGIVYVGSGYVLEDQMNSTVSGGNYEFVMGCLSKLANHETTTAIASKSMEVDYLTITAAGVRTLSAAVTVVLPAVLMIFGGLIWYKRRKR